MEFRGTNISAEDIDRAIDQIRNGQTGKYDTPSDTTYIKCRITKEIWDFKPVVGRAFENALVDPHSFGWVTTSFQPQILGLGFTIMKFKAGKGRKLGLRGFDNSELNDEHEILQNDSSINRLISKAKGDGHIEPPEKQTTTASRFIRNSQIAQQIREQSDGYCDACGLRTFQTASGNWYVEIHHKQWLREGGHDVSDNLVPLCPTCHRAEHHSQTRRYK